MNVNYAKLIKSVKGASIPQPLSGTLSGHTTGEPFDKHVYNEVKKQLPDNTFRQYEYLNDLYSKNAKIIGLSRKKMSFEKSILLLSALMPRAKKQRLLPL